MTKSNELPARGKSRYVCDHCFELITGKEFWQNEDGAVVLCESCDSSALASQSPAQVDDDVQAALDAVDYIWNIDAVANRSTRTKVNADLLWSKLETIKRALTATKHDVNEKLVEALKNLIPLSNPRLGQKYADAINMATEALKSAQLSCSTGTKDKVDIETEIRKFISEQFKEDGTPYIAEEKNCILLGMPVDENTSDWFAKLRAFYSLQQLTKKD